MTARAQLRSDLRAHGFRLRTLALPGVPSVLCVAIAAVSALLAVYDVAKLATIAASQLQGPAVPTDFLNLYSGASLFRQQPPAMYQLDAQLSLQRTLTGYDSQLVPFYLPPYSALLVSWLSWLPYGLAYLVWLGIGIGCILLAIAWLAPRWTRWSVLLWFGLAMLFLPVVLGLAQGQTSALLLLACAAFVRGFLLPGSRFELGLSTASVVGWVLKPQLAPFVLLALVVSRRWLVLLGAGVVVGLLTGVSALRLAGPGLAQYLLVSQQKTYETLNADPVFLIGPTLLHACHWFIGVNGVAHALAVLLITLAVGSAVFVWRSGPASDDRLLLQLAMLPIVAVIAAPYALIYELAPWLASFWLLWHYTAARQPARAGLLWLAAGVWVSANIGVSEPHAGGADVAALFGLALAGFIAWLYHVHASEDPAVSLATLPRRSA